MSPTQQKSLLHLAASLGSDEARSRLSASDLESLGDAFRVLMSQADCSPQRFEYGPMVRWPYTFAAALRMGVAAFRELAVDWNEAFGQTPELIPPFIERGFPQEVLGTIEGWLRDPELFNDEVHGELYVRIKYDTCLDGYLPNEFPKLPPVIPAWALGSLLLIDGTNWRDPRDERAWVICGGPDEFQPDGMFSGNVPDAIGFLLATQYDDSRIRRAVTTEVVPWCLGSG